MSIFICIYCQIREIILPLAKKPAGIYFDIRVYTVVTRSRDIRLYNTKGHVKYSLFQNINLTFSVYQHLQVFHCKTNYVGDHKPDSCFQIQKVLSPQSQFHMVSRTQGLLQTFFIHIFNMYVSYVYV